MTSNKTIAALFLTTLTVKTVASTTPDGTQGPRSSKKSALRVRKLGHVSVTGKNVIRDADNTVKAVEVSMDQGKLNEIFEPARGMGPDELLKQIFTNVKTLGQFKGLVDRNNLMKSFYLHGDLRIVKEVIADSRVHETHDFDRQLGVTFLQIFEEGRHDRFIELFNVRREIPGEEDELLEKEGRQTSFEQFVFLFLDYFVIREDGMALFILMGDEFRGEYPDIFDTLCHMLVKNLNVRLSLGNLGEKFDLNTKKLLTDLIGQPSLITPEAFAKGFLRFGEDGSRSNFIKYGWREAIQEGLKTKYLGGGDYLWQVMQNERPDQFPGELPSTEEARTAVLAKFPTKKDLEDEWIKKYFTIFFNRLNDESVSHIFPTVLWSIIFEYALSLVFTWNLTTSTQ